MSGKDIEERFKAGALVYYRGFNIFPPENESPYRQHMGIIIGVPNGLPHEVSFIIYWFESRLTTRMHYDMIKLVYEKWGLGLQFGNALLFIDMDDTTLPLRNIQYLIREALTKTDKEEVKRIVRKELDDKLKEKLAKAVEDEVSKALSDKSTKDEIGEISKKIIKKLYKDLSFHHPYIIDRIKV